MEIVGLRMLIGLLIGIALLIFLVLKTKVQAFLALILSTIVVGLIGGILGQIGDLFASLEKRHCGIKDFSHIFPGHGGMMDRLDSVFFATLAVYLYSLMYSASLEANAAGL